ncbi:MFS transporter [Providencia rettgeri]|uniref:MFS transporter n=1 Tax=Providencia rettgeri TaxID=587 RepID=UPI001C82C35B|nr:MFS transporter [Providencia rettgeri]MBX6968891.1 MFS transporter [Providencia rettgeri]MBX6977557.1 MFS transporter [Providencia rettgeri]MBX6994625.1 MFS transporter [Providencia rettgeri]MBX6999472.1 MFS transporter [Providencia rettgeri]MBX7018853.1 MFS transporter [Providencia rettgeri]
MTQNNEQGWSVLLTGKNLWLTLALAGGICLHAINVYITITTLPSVVRDIGGIRFYAWNTTLFILSSIILSALTSRILNHLGPKRSYLLATAIFLIGSVICAITPSMFIMLLGRIIQGAGGGILLTLSYSMVHIVFPQHLWSKVLAMMSSMWGMATLLGPALGGFFAEYDIWRSAFWCLVFVGIPYLWLTWLILPSHNLTEKCPQDPIPLQALLLLSAAVLAISLGSLSKASLIPILGMLIAILLCIRLVKLERTAENTLFPQGTFHYKAQLAPIYLTMALLGLSVQTEVFVPYFLQTLHGVAPLMSGYLAALVGAGWSCSAIISSSCKPEHAIKTIRIGPFITFSALAILALFITNIWQIETLQIWIICLALFTTGASIGAAWPHLLTRVLQVSIGPESQKASSAITTLQLFSTAFGASLAGLIANLAGLSVPGGVEGAQSSASWLFAVFSLIPLLALMTANIVANRMKGQ